MSIAHTVTPFPVRERRTPNRRAGSRSGPNVFESADEAYPQHEPGIYSVWVVGYTGPYCDPRFHRYVLMMRCRLTISGITGADSDDVVGFFPVPDNGRFGRGSNYWRTWVLANGDQPRRHDRMSPRVLVGKMFRVRIARVEFRFDGKTDRDPSSWKKHSPAAQYSTISEWIECEGP